MTAISNLLMKPKSKSNRYLQINTLNAFSLNLFQKQWNFQEESVRPYKIKKTLKPKYSHLKGEILTWFKRLSIQQKQKVCIIRDTKFIQNFILKVQNKSSNRLFNFQFNKCMEMCWSKKQQTDDYFLQLIGKIRLAIFEQRMIYFQKDLILQDLMKWLDKISHYNCFQYDSFHKQNLQNILWFSSKSFHTLQQYLANELQMCIYQAYNMKISRMFDLQNFKQFLVLNNKSHMTKWLELMIREYEIKQNQQLKKIENKLKYELEKYQQIKQQEQMRKIFEIDTDKKKKRKGRKKLIKLSQPKQVQQFQKIEEVIDQKSDTKHDQIHDYSTIEQKSFISNILSQDSPISQVTSSVQKNQSDSNINILSVDSINSLLVQQQEIQIKQKNQKQLLTGQTSILCLTEQKIDKQQQLIKSGEKISKRKKKKTKKQNSNLLVLQKTIFHKFLSDQILNIIQKLNHQTNSKYQAKITSFQRIRFFIKLFFPYSEAVLFGSNAIGLALPNSDVDILLTQLPCLTRDDAAKLLSQFKIHFDNLRWVKSSQVYGKAKVPILKLQIDPSNNFLQGLQPRLIQFFDINLINFLNREKASSIIKIDISINIEGISNIGHESTLLMKNWMQKQSIINNIVLFFKYLLSNYDYNQNYKGGIGSYCLFTMIVAYIKEEMNCADLQLSEIIQKILQWYSNDFDNNKYVIWLRENEKCFILQEEVKEMLNGKNKPSLLKIVDPATNTLMNGSCSEFQNIKLLFKNINLQFQDIFISISQQIKSKNMSKVQLQKFLSNKKKIDKQVQKYRVKYRNVVEQILTSKYN